MNIDDMIRMAREAGWEYADGDRGFEPLWAFANLVAKHEREACAKVVEEYFGVGHEDGADCVLVIRQRSQS
jgi:hypothetical protein